MYARIENDQIVEWPIVNIYQRLPQVSFSEPINHANLPDGFVYVAPPAIPEYNPVSQTVVLNAPIMVAGSWQQVYSVVDLSAAQLQANADSAVQALRDIPSQSGFPADIQWPTAPV